MYGCAVQCAARNHTLVSVDFNSNLRRSSSGKLKTLRIRYCQTVSTANPVADMKTGAPPENVYMVMTVNSFRNCSVLSFMANVVAVILFSISS